MSRQMHAESGYSMGDICSTLGISRSSSLVAEGLIALDKSFPDFLEGAWSINRVVSKGKRGQRIRCSIESIALATKPFTFMLESIILFPLYCNL